MRAVKIFIIGISLVCMVGCDPQPVYQSRAEEVFPAVTIKYAALFRMDELPITAEFFRGQWTALVFGSASCEADCQQRLALLDEIKQAQPLLVIDDLADHNQLRKLKKEYPGVAISMGTTAASIDNFILQFAYESILPADRRRYIYVVNPAPEFFSILLADGLKAGDIDQELLVLKNMKQD